MEPFTAPRVHENHRSTFNCSMFALWLWFLYFPLFLLRQHYTYDHNYKQETGSLPTTATLSFGSAGRIPSPYFNLLFKLDNQTKLNDYYGTDKKALTKAHVIKQNQDESLYTTASIPYFMRNHPILLQSTNIYCYTQVTDLFMLLR